MNTVMAWISRHPSLSLILALLIAGGFSLGTGNLRFDSSSEGLLAANDPDVDAYREVVETFGDDIVLSIILRTDDVFREDVLQSIADLTDAGMALDGVTRVVSMATVSNLKGVDGMLYTDELLAYVPTDPDQLAELRRDALRNEILVSEVINDDGRTAAVHLFLESRPEDPDFEERLIGEIELLMEAERLKLGRGTEIYQVGKPYLKLLSVDLLISDLTLLFPIALVAILLTLQVFFRSFAAAVVPAITGLLSVAATLGVMGFLDFAVNPLSVIIPLLLVVIGCTEDIHLLAEYEVGLRQRLEKHAAVRTMAVKSGLAILLTSLTTFVGFLTIAPNAIPMLREFGIAASLGIAINFILTVLLVPSILRFLKAPNAFLGAERESLQWLRSMVITVTTRHQTRVVVAAIVVTLVSVAGCLRIVVDTDYLRMFDEDSEVRKLYRDVSDHLAGAMNFVVIVDTKTEYGIQDPRVLADVAKLSDYMAERFDKVLGYVDYLRKLHVELNDGDLSFRRVPESSDLVSQYTLLLDPDDLDRFVDFDFTKTAIMVRTDNLGSRELIATVAEIENFARNNLSRDLDVRVTGESVLIAKASNTIAGELLINIGWVLLAIFILISVLFVSLKAGLLAMIPNVLPALTTFGFMGWLEIPLSTATFPVVVIALGIAVDDTVHFMVRFSEHMKSSSDNEEVLIRTVNDELRPICTTTAALIIGFAMLTLAEFGSVAEFGILAAIAMASAFIADIFVTPVLLQAVPLISAWDLMKVRISDEVLANSPLFRGLKPREVKRIALLGELKRFSAEEYIMRQGEEGNDIMVFLRGSGRVVAQDKNESKIREIRKIRPGGVIGEVGFFGDGRRSASIIASEDVEVLQIDGPRLERVQRRFPKVASKLYYNLSQLLGSRLSSVTQSLVEETSS